jgi:hypothetical protein
VIRAKGSRRPVQRPFQLLRDAEMGPKVFSIRRLATEDHLFEQRAALYFTPTANLPAPHVGMGILDVTVPLAVPTWTEFLENRAHRVPRLWVDLIQRATQRIRWTPMRPAAVTFFAWDSCAFPLQDLPIKALLDALKEKSAGRRDGRILHYFGAIRDDNGRDLRRIEVFHGLVASPAEARTRIVVRPTPEDTPLEMVSSYLA